MEGNSVASVLTLPVILSAAEVLVARLKFSGRGRNDISCVENMPLCQARAGCGEELCESICQVEGACSMGGVEGAVCPGGVEGGDCR